MSELQTGTKPNRYALATRETLLGLLGQRDQYKAELDNLRFNRQAELTELERKTHIKYDNEIKKYKKALEQCLIVLSCMNDLSHTKRDCKCINIIEEALK